MYGAFGLCTASVWLLSAAQPAASDAPAATPNVAVPSPLRVAMTGTYWPLHGGSGAERQGLEAEIARALARELGVKLQFVGSEVGVGTIEAVATGKADIAINAITPTASRRQQVDFTPPYLQLNYRLLHRHDTPAPDNLDELRGRKIAASNGPAADAAQKVEGGVVVPVRNLRAALAKLKAMEVDFVFGEDVELLEVMHQGPWELTELKVGTSDLAVATPKGMSTPYATALARIGPFIGSLADKYLPGVWPGPDEGMLLYFDGAIEGVMLEVNRAGKLAFTPSDQRRTDFDFTSPWGAACNFPGLVIANDAAAEARVRARISGPHDRLGEVAGWLRLADGTRITAIEWVIHETCQYEEYQPGPDGEPQVQIYNSDCNSRGWYVGGVRGAETVVERIEVLDRT